MRQALHIFRKDVRRCWPYIAAVVALTAVNAWLGCREVEFDYTPQADRAQKLFPFLLALGWWLAVSSAVHGESLVGDRQFWVTRPYSWRSLLAAKLMFLAAFVGLPMFLSDAVILLHSAFNPLPLIPGLLLRQGWLAAFLVLPFLISSLTRTLRDFVLAVLAFYIGGVAAMALAEELFAQSGWAFPLRPSWVWDTVPWLLPVAGLSLATWQFARRQTARPRTLAVGLAILLPLWAAPLLIPPPKTTIVPDDPRCRDIGLRFDTERRPDRATIEGRDGYTFVPMIQSGWPAGLLDFGLVHVKVLERGREMFAADFGMVPSTDGRDWILLTPVPGWLTTHKVDLWVSTDIRVYEQHGSANLRPDGGWTYVPDFGSVALKNGTFGSRYLIVRTALQRLPNGWHFRMNGGPSRVFLDEPPPLAASPLTFNPSPVYSKAGFAPGLGVLRAPLVFSPERPLGRVHRELTIPQIKLADYLYHSPQ
jgi:hypothetical protein